jgi:hypothetical protein
MTTLTTAPLALLLDSLFEEAAEASPATSPALADSLRSGKPHAEQGRRLPQILWSLKEFSLAVSRESGVCLYMLREAAGAQPIASSAPLFGISTLHSPPP